MNLNLNLSSSFRWISSWIISHRTPASTSLASLSSSSLPALSTTTLKQITSLGKRLQRWMMNTRPEFLRQLSQIFSVLYQCFFDIQKLLFCFETKIKLLLILLIFSIIWAQNFFKSLKAKIIRFLNCFLFCDS